MLITTWTDPRLAIKTAPAMTLYGTDVFDKGLIWGPKLTFANRRDLTNPIDGVVRSYNTGRVEVVQRYLATYAMNFNMRDFPFDSQRLAWNLRSTTFNKSVVMFSPVTDVASVRNSSLLLQSLLDPTFSYSNYNQTTYTLTDGIFANYHLLSVSIDAQRIATMSSIFLVFPICILCAALCLVLSQEPANNARLSVPLGVITSCLAFSYVVSNQCPPVSYTTRMHLMIFFTYVISIITLVINYYLWAVEFSKRELARLNLEKKNLLMDAHWMPRKIANTPTKVIVLPGGIHKQADKEPKTEGKKADAGAAIGKQEIEQLDLENQSAHPPAVKDVPALPSKARLGTPGSSLSNTPRRSAWETDAGRSQQKEANECCETALPKPSSEVGGNTLIEVLQNPPLPGAVDSTHETLGSLSKDSANVMVQRLDLPKSLHQKPSAEEGLSEVKIQKAIDNSPPDKVCSTTLPFVRCNSTSSTQRHCDFSS